MAAILVTPPSVEPISLAEAKAHARVEVPNDDGYLSSLVTVSREHLENETRRAFNTQTWDLTLDYDWPRTRLWNYSKPRIVLPRPPVQSVTSVSYIDTAGASQVLASDQYKLARGNTGEWFIEPAYNVTWPSVRQELATITIRFVAGYGSTANDVPKPLRQAMLLLVGHWYEQREAVNVGNIVNEFPFAVANLVFPYRVFY